MRMFNYDNKYKLAICLNGHEYNAYVGLEETVDKFCPKCGERIITECPHCNAFIPGYVEYDGVISSWNGPHEAYCETCGNPLPWTERTLSAASDLIGLSDLSDSEKRGLDGSIKDLVTDSPRSSAAVARIKILSSKIGSTVMNGLRDVLVDVLSEATKKAIWGA